MPEFTHPLEIIPFMKKSYENNPKAYYIYIYIYIYIYVKKIA